MRCIPCLVSLALLAAACGPAAPSTTPIVAVTPAGSGAPGGEPPAEESPCPDGMAYIAASTFKMGSSDKDRDADDDERPQHAVTLKAFCIAKTETTVAQYDRCAKSGRCKAAPTTSLWNESEDDERGSAHCNASRQDRLDHPINCVDWSMATAYCKAQGLRLPTEEEWELAARGEQGRRYPWGSGKPRPDLLNACGTECVDVETSWGGTTSTFASEGLSDAWPTTSPVGLFPSGATPEGVLDLQGNVLEWTSTEYCSYAEPDCGIGEYSTRGGGWPSSELNVRNAARGRGIPDHRHEALGFRCAKSL